MLNTPKLKNGKEMKCQDCGCILAPDEEDQILQAIAEGIRPSRVLCEDCIDFYTYDGLGEYDENDFD